jgi:hypothetical protein
MSAPARAPRPIDTLKNLPQNLDAEKSFLGSIFLDNQVIDREILTPQDFSLDAHKKIYQVMLEMWEDRIPIDSVTLGDNLEKKGWGGLTGGSQYIDDLSWIVPTAANAPHYARILQEKTAERQAILDAEKLKKAALSGVPEDMARVREEIAKVSKPGKMRWTKHRVDISRAATTKPPAQKFIVGHLPDEPGNYGLLIGPDGVRKSWLALHIALSVAGGRPVAIAPDGSCLWGAPEQGRVVYITSEDSPDVVWRRVWNISRMPGYLWVPDMDKNLDILPVFSSMTLLSTLQDGSIVQTPEFSELIEYTKGARLIILDPLADLFDLDENGNREGRAIVQALRQLSLQTGAGVLGVHHQNKASMLSGEKNHQSGRGSSKFGAGCRWAVVLQPLSEDEAEKSGIEGQERADWSLVHESKASYADEVAGDRWFHKVAVVDDKGHLTATAPLAARFSEGKSRLKKRESTKREEPEYATPY